MEHEGFLFRFREQSTQQVKHHHLPQQLHLLYFASMTTLVGEKEFARLLGPGVGYGVVVGVGLAFAILMSECSSSSTSLKRRH
jgi:hypothetical protein